MFIGSTFRDHKAQREELIRAVYSAGHIPSGMELWDSDSRPLEETLQSKLDQCDVHVLLVGATYGSPVPQHSTLRTEIGFEPNVQLSFTHWEYLKSVQDRRPLIAFVSDSIPQDKSNALKKRLRDFRKSVTESRFCKHYSVETVDANGELEQCLHKVNALELSKNVINALSEIETNRILTPVSSGWIRADSDEAYLLREIRNNRFLKRIMDRLRQFDVLTSRVLTAPDEKSMAAEVFWKTLTGSIRRSGRRNVFFESGSTLAFVSEVFERYVLANLTVGPDWRVWTNNVESLLQLELHTDVEVVAFPSDSPDPKDKYGAIFDKSFFEVDEPAPTKPRSLYTDDNYWPKSRSRDSHGQAEHPRNERRRSDRLQHSEASVVKKTKADLKSALMKDGGGIVCVTASGLECKARGARNEWKLGPHTGSHANMLLKRAAYTTGEPTVIFLHENKIGKNFEVGQCFPVFLTDYDWNRFRRSFPIAVCVGYTCPLTDSSDEERTKLEMNKKKTEISSLLKNLGFKRPLANTVRILDSDFAVGAAISANGKFCSKLNL